MAGLLRWQHPSWYQWENSIYQLKMIKPKGRDRLSPKSHHWVAILSSEPSTPGLLVVWDSWSPLFFQPVLVVGSVTGCQTCSLWSRDLLKPLHFFFHFISCLRWLGQLWCIIWNQNWEVFVCPFLWIPIRPSVTLILTPPRNSPTPAGYPTLQLNSDTTYLETASLPTG